MEEDKAAAYYEELTRKGEGAARFKQGLGFSSTCTQSNDSVTKGSALPSKSSFLSSFVKASSSPSKSEQIDGKSAEIERNVQLQNVKNKLKKKEENFSRVSDRHARDERRRSRDRYDSRVSRKDRDHRDRDSRDGNRSRDRDRGERRRSRSRSRSDGERRRSRSSRERRGGRRRSRSSSPRDKRLEKSRIDGKGSKEKSGGVVDYARLIEGYAEMTPAERVKAKMKLQLNQTAEKDINKGMGSGWERFDFNKDAPLDNEEDEIEEAEDDAVVVKKMGQSFRFAAVEARREEQIKAAHDEAMFGAPVGQQPSIASRDMELNTEDDDNISNSNGDNKETTENVLISDTVLAKQQGSWRDRARRPKNG
ncbi:hypothetical protein ACHQM5_008466 [Ranunculus cassubicifolius]